MQALSRSTRAGCAHRARAAVLAAFFAAACLGCGGGPNSASELSAGPESLALRGTSSTFLEVEANGAWVARAEPSWLSVSPAEGEGDETLEVQVDRSGLETDTYAGAITLLGDAETTASVPVLMRFPQVQGHVHSPEDNLQAQRRIAPAIAERRPGRDYVSGEILVGLDRKLVAIEEHGVKSGALDPDLEPSRQGLERAAERVGARVGAQKAELVSPVIGLAKLHIDQPEVDAAMPELRRDGRVRYAEPNEIMELHTADDSHYDLQWHYQNINLEGAWDITTGYEETEVAVIDVDFYPDHPDLAASLLPGYDFRNESEDLVISNPACGAHGTHVAGTVAAVTNNGSGVAGVAPAVGILPLNLADDHGDPDDDPDNADCGLFASDSARAILYAAGAWDPEAGQRERPVDVINLSIGGESPSDARAEALEFARDAGVVVVSSSGNNGEEVTYPAADPNAAAIAATNLADEKASYSAPGPEVWVAAPGGERGQTIPGTDVEARVLSSSFDYPLRTQSHVEVLDDEGHAYEVKSGTSMASPHAAGVAALVRSVNPDLSPSLVLQILAETAVDLGEPERDPEYGHGLLDAEAAVALARDQIRVSPDELVARLYDGGELLREARVDPGGSFELGSVPAGDYTLVAGSLRDGDIDVPGTVYGEQSVTVEYDGDPTFRIAVSGR